MTKIPTTPRRFLNWLCRQPLMPTTLWDAANEVYRVLKTLELNRGARDLGEIRKIFLPRVDKFHKDYNNWLEKQS